ncbi:glycosyltransferase family 4 protein [Microbacterium sp. 179-I 3D3 NHS]|uniref:glycosyltransferase family 4 protein n=1 Tax=Microbacterium sp. 179-I 3D3 NHS TaxID=3142382 RepID=UPI00399F44D2
MRSVWLVNHYATDPTESPSGSRHFSLAAHLAQEGWTASLIAASTEHPSGRQRIPSSAKRADRTVGGVRFRFLRASDYSGNGISRILNLLTFTVRLLLPSGTRGLPAPDVIVGSTVHPLAAWAASVLARRRRVPFVFEIRDLWPQTLIDMGRMTPRSLPARILRAVEGELCRRASAIITLLPFAAEYLEQEQGVPADKIVWISNGCDAAAFSHLPAAEPDGPFTFMYFGSVGLANGVDEIVRAFAPVADGARLTVYGGGRSLPQVQALAGELGIRDAVEFRGTIPKTAVPEAAALADALVINVLDLAVYRHGISMNKLFDYLAAGRPVVIASSAPNNPVAESEAGLTVPAADTAAFTAALRRMRDSDLEERRRWGANGRALVEEQYDYGVLARRLASTLDAVLAGVRPDASDRP